MFNKACALSLAVFIGMASSARADNVVVFQDGKKFSETEVTIKVGDSVTYTNKDPITHNVYSNTPGVAFDLKMQKAGESSEIKFDHAGDALVQCAIHPQMKMTVKVQ
ncbi:MAG TPA: plastocyanin/azurin family copper-binding protein [Stellaceae bacterium]|nr:plastocyanin/azurin family copper-binding protein [Stellaceae bacterium]